MCLPTLQFGPGQIGSVREWLAYEVLIHVLVAPDDAGVLVGVAVVESGRGPRRPPDDPPSRIVTGDTGTRRQVQLWQPES